MTQENYPLECQKLLFIKILRLIRHFREIMTVQTDHGKFFQTWPILHDYREAALTYISSKTPCKKHLEDRVLTCRRELGSNLTLEFPTNGETVDTGPASLSLLCSSAINWEQSKQGRPSSAPS